MNKIYNKCRLRDELEEKKKRLNKMIEEKNFNLLDKDILTLSIEVDEVIHKCISSEQKFFHKEMNLS